MQNPFEVMADELGSIRELMRRLHPLSYTTVYKYVRGYQGSFGYKMREVLKAHYGAERAEQIEREYHVWRGERAKEAIGRMRSDWGASSGGRSDEGVNCHFA